MATSNSKWKNDIQSALVECNLQTSGAINFGYICAHLFGRGYELSRDSILELLKDGLDTAKSKGNADEYSEILLALRFFEMMLSEIESPKVE